MKQSRTVALVAHDNKKVELLRWAAFASPLLHNGYSLQRPDLLAS